MHNRLRTTFFITFLLPAVFLASFSISIPPVFASPVTSSPVTSSPVASSPVAASPVSASPASPSQVSASALAFPDSILPAFPLNSVASYILVDASNGNVLLEYHSNQKLYPASTTKMMTAIIAIEKSKGDTVMTASRTAIEEIGAGGMNIGIMEGEHLLMKDLLGAVVVRSANEAANIIAENITSSRDGFAAVMNSKAAELGAFNTHFVNACGLHHPEHYTTAADLARIACYAISLPAFHDLAGRSIYYMSPTDKHPIWDPLPSTNKLLSYSPKKFTKITGIKTGFTSNSGYNLVSAGADVHGNELVAVVLGGVNSIQDNIYNVSAALLEYGFTNYQPYTAAEAGQVISEIRVRGAALNDTVTLTISDDIVCFVPTGFDTSATSSAVEITAGITAPVDAGQQIGKITFTRGSVLIGSSSLIAADSAARGALAKVGDAIASFTGKPATRFIAKMSMNTLLVIWCFLIIRYFIRIISKSVRYKIK